MTKRKAKNGDAPVTQKDQSLLAGEMSRRFDTVDARFDAVDNRLDAMQADLTSLRNGQEAILGVMTSIDLQLRELKTLPVRVERLERSRR